MMTAVREHKNWLPITKKESDERGWEQLDIVIVTGDAYVDHPGFGAAVIGRVLEAQGYKVAIIPQPNWQDDGRDFKKFGQPRLFFGVTAGCMDSMVNHYTANKRLRSDDAYTPGGQSGFRPDYPTVVYTQMLKKFFPQTPVILGGIEASLRRITHYDYWQDKLRPSFLHESKADLLVYGMGEKPIVEVAKILDNGGSVNDCQNVLQISYRTKKNSEIAPFEGIKDVVLASHEECLKSKKTYSQNFRILEEESNKTRSARLIQEVANEKIVINPPYPVMTEQEIDASFDLPYTRLPHPKYLKRGVIPAYEMIRHSVNIHRGCFGACSFCTISAHQGRHVASRSKKSILKEVQQVVEMHDFKGYLSDLGGPSANMYKMQKQDENICLTCKRASCAFPKVCKNLDTDHTPLLELYKEVAQNPAVKKAFIGSGIRYDLLFDQNGKFTSSGRKYAEYVIKNNVSGRLKVAPEHTCDEVLKLMRKPSFKLFKQFKGFFDETCKKNNLRYQLIPYFISGHPGCTQEHMRLLADETGKMGYRLEQVQSFTPTPLTLATEMYYSGINPYTGEAVKVARGLEEKKAQNAQFFRYKKRK